MNEQKNRRYIMYFETKFNTLQGHQIIRDEKVMILDKIYADQKRKRHNHTNPFNH